MDSRTVRVASCVLQPSQISLSRVPIFHRLTVWGSTPVPGASEEDCPPQLLVEEEDSSFHAHEED